MGIVTNLEAWKSSLEVNKQGSVACNVINVVATLENAPELKGCLSYDTFAKRFMCGRETPWGSVAGTEWSGTDMGEFMVWLQQHDILINNEQTVTLGASIVAHRNQYNPLENYLNGLEWDDIPRIHNWLSRYMGAENTLYTRTVGPKFLVSAVARGLRPGCQVDTSLVLEGVQGIGKTRAVITLAGADWYCDDIGDISNKDSVLQLQGKWLIEIAEMSAFKRAQIEKVKAYISRRSDRMRPPYGKTTQDFKRQCVMVVTTNDSHYLKDSTGNRRYWPVCCGSVDVEGLERDRNRLWAEAVASYRRGQQWWLNDDEVVMATDEQRSRLEDDTWLPAIADFVASRSRVTTTYILTHCLEMNLYQTHLGHSHRIGDCMRRLGWEEKRVRRKQYTDRAEVKQTVKETYEWRPLEPGS